MTALAAPNTEAVTTARAPRGRRRTTEKLPWGNPFVYFVALVVIALMLAPVLYIIIGGFRSNSQITVDPAGWPDPWNIENYLTVLTGPQFWGQVLNSVIAATATTEIYTTLDTLSLHDALPIYPARPGARRRR